MSDVAIGEGCGAKTAVIYRLGAAVESEPELRACVSNSKGNGGNGVTYQGRTRADRVIT